MEGELVYQYGQAVAGAPPRKRVRKAARAAAPAEAAPLRARAPARGGGRAPDGHHSVCRQEGLFHAVPVVHINIQVQHPARGEGGGGLTGSLEEMK